MVKTKTRNYCFKLRQDQRQNCCHGNSTTEYLVPSLKDTASIFPEILFIQYFTILVVNLMTSSFS